MKRNKIFTIMCLTLLAEMPGYALTQPNDSLHNNKRFFNATDYVLQKRYVPAGRTVKKNAPGKNWSVSLFGGAGKLAGQGSGLPVMPELGIGVQKEVNSFNAYRLSVIGESNDVLKRAGIEIDHLFDIQNYLTGYKDGGFLNVSTVIGAGAYMVFPEKGENKFAAGLHGGLRISRLLSNNIEVYVEPRLNLYTDGIDAKVSPRKYNLGANARAGLTYRFTGVPFKGVRNLDALDNLFYELYTGVQADFSKRVRNFMSTGSMLGPTAGASVGKWWLPLGVRGTLFGGFHYTPNDQYKSISEEVYGGGRIEALVNLNNFFCPSVTEPKVEVNVAGGYELGLLMHRASGNYTKEVRPFHGFTFAGQLLYAVNNRWGVFAQARWSKNRYNQPFKSGITEKRFMQNLGLELGVQYRRRSEEVKEKSYKFEPYNFVTASLGTNFPVDFNNLKNGNLKNKLGQEYSIGLGRRFTMYSAARVNLTAGRYAYGNSQGTYPLSISADYMLEMMTLIDGYKPDRVFSLSPFVGVVYTHHETADKNLAGFRVGLNEHFSLNEKWGLFLEQGMNVYSGKITETARTFYNGKLSAVLSASAGVSYRF